jgi:hypothetical protein
MIFIFMNKRCRFFIPFLHLHHHLPFSLRVRRQSEMAPKKKQNNSNKPNSNSSSRAKPQASSSSSSSGPRLQISAENENRLRRLLLNNNSTRSGSTPVDDSLSKAQKAKKLKTVYEKLSCEGFTNDQIELALSALKVNMSLSFISHSVWLPRKN